MFPHFFHSTSNYHKHITDERWPNKSVSGECWSNFQLPHIMSSSITNVSPKSPPSTINNPWIQHYHFIKCSLLLPKKCKWVALSSNRNERKRKKRRSWDRNQDYNQRRAIIIIRCNLIYVHPSKIWKSVFPIMTLGRLCCCCWRS